MNKNDNLEKDNDLENTKKVTVKYSSTVSLGFSTMGQLILGYLICLVFFIFTVSLSNIIARTVLQIVQIFLMASFPYGRLWYEGDRNRNLVKFNHVEYDKFRGLKAGIISILPLLLIYSIMIIAYAIKHQTLYNLYRIINFPFLLIVMTILGHAEGSYADINGVTPIQMVFLALLPTVFIIPPVLGYYLGYKGISISEKIQFKDLKKSKDKTEKNTDI